MKHLQTLTAIVAVAAMAVGVAGCGSSSDSEDAGPVTLKLWTGFTGGDRPGYAKIVKDFEASHKNIKIDMTVQPWDTIQQKLPSAWMTGEGPDVATMSSDPNAVEQYVKTNSVLPLTETGDGANQINVDKFAPGIKAEFTYKGKIYAAPANFSTLSLYYNKKLFKTAGINEPPATVKDMQEDAKRLSNGNQYGIALADNNTIANWPILQWLEGGDIVNKKNCSVVQTPVGQKSLKVWSALVVQNKISPVGLTGAEADSLFSAGKAGMEINGPWAASAYKEAGVDFGIVPIPVGAAGKSVTLGSVTPISISSKTKYPKQAQEFLAYWTSKETQKKFALQTGFPPVRTDLTNDADLKADATVSVFQKQISNARMYLSRVPNATKVDSDAYTPLIGNITRGKSVEDETKTAETTINSLTGCAQ